MNPSLRGQILPIVRRSVRRTVRQPVLVVPNIVFPLFMLAVLSSGASQATKIPGFPTRSYLTFILGATLVQGASNATTLAGNLLAKDIETGFMNRMLLTPVQRSALMTAQLAGVAVVGAIQATIFLVVGLLAGASVKAGVLGALALGAVAILFVLAFGSIGLLAAVVGRSATKVQGLSALFLGLMFMSSMLMPRNLITHEWFKTIATYNPLSYLVEATRSLLITGWDAQALALGCGIAALGIIAALAGCSIILRRTLVRT